MSINEDGDLNVGYVAGITDLDEYFEYDDGTLNIKKKAYYNIVCYNYELVINQETTEKIYLHVWVDGDLELNNVNSYTAQNSHVTANGEMVINNSNLYFESTYNEDSSINAEDDIIINNSKISVKYDTTYDNDSFHTMNANIHSYYGDIKIKNNSNVDVSGRIYSDDGSISIEDSLVTLDGIWGYLESGYDLSIVNSTVNFLF